MLCWSLFILALLSLPAFVATGPVYESIEAASLWVRNRFGPFYLWTGLGCVIAALVIAISPLGAIRLGAAGEKPAHSLWAWTAMLYSAGMGAGILLRAVQEPVYFSQHPPYPSSMDPNVLALEYTFYQWGLTPWAFYGIFAMAVGYGIFVRNRPVRISETVSHRIRSKSALATIDILTILTTVFGLVAAVGLGTAQIGGGLDFLSGWGDHLGSQLAIASLISALALYSAWRGLDRGIKLLSKVNLLGALGLLAIVVLAGDIPAILGLFFRAGGTYLRDLLPMSLALGPFDPGEAFLTDWTYYYWAFWLAWAPFTGIFIARISRGRSIRQLLLGVLILPSLGTFLWFSAFGQSAFAQIDAWGGYAGEFSDVFSSIFVFLSAFPASGGLNVLAILLLVGFLVTSVDSAIYVLSMFTDGGRQDPGRRHRLLWGVFLWIATLAILLLGNARADIDVLSAAQKLLIITSLPFTLFLVSMSLLFLLDRLNGESGKPKAKDVPPD